MEFNHWVVNEWMNEIIYLMADSFACLFCPLVANVIGIQNRFDSIRVSAMRWIPLVLRSNTVFCVDLCSIVFSVVWPEYYSIQVKCSTLESNWSTNGIDDTYTNTNWGRNRSDQIQGKQKECDWNRLIDFIVCFWHYLFINHCLSCHGTPKQHYCTARSWTRNGDGSIHAVEWESWSTIVAVAESSVMTEVESLPNESQQFKPNRKEKEVRGRSGVRWPQRTEGRMMRRTGVEDKSVAGWGCDRWLMGLNGYGGGWR